MTPTHYLLLATLGLLAGYINVLAGGGSLLTLPLMIFLGLPGATANGTNRIAILLQNITAILTFRKRGLSDIKLSLTLALAALPGSIIGALAGTRIQGPWFNRILASVMIIVLLAMHTKNQTTPQQKPQPLSPQRHLYGHLSMFGIGLYVGFIQAGVGIIIMTVLHRIMRLDLIRVNMHKVFIIAFITLPALLIYALNGNVLWGIGLSLATGQTIGAWIGTHSAVNHGEKHIRTILKIATALMALRLIYTTL